MLGDTQAQADIRLAHPKVQHCDKLEINARACIGCSKNPMKPEKLEKKDKLDAVAPILTEAFELEHQSRLGLLSMNDLNSVQMNLLSQSRVRREFDRDERLAILIANKMGEILNKMFGAK